jgi:multidrug efflux system membrane fusion protein
MIRCKKIWGSTLVVLLVGGAIYFATERSETVASTAYPPVKVALATVTRQDVPRLLSGVGELQADKQVMVSSETSGKVMRILFESGQAVKAGQALVQLNDAPEAAERTRLQARLTLAQAQLTRIRALVVEDAATKEQFDQAIAEANMAKSELARIQALINQKTIRAPFSGLMGIRKINVGQFINSGDAVASLVDAATLRAQFALNEKIIPQLNVGQLVNMTVDALPNEVFQAKITAIDSLVLANKMVDIQATLDNPNGLLKAGMYAKVSVQQSTVSQALAAPETAVTYTAYGDSVFVATMDAKQKWVVKRVPVKLGERWDGQVEVVSGLKENDKVVTSGQLKLIDGANIEAIKDDTLHKSITNPVANSAVTSDKGAS